MPSKGRPPKPNVCMEPARSPRTLDGIHEIGANRHPHSWLNANRLAVGELWAENIRMDDESIKRAVSLIVLRVLDYINAP